MNPSTLLSLLVSSEKRMPLWSLTSIPNNCPDSEGIILQCLKSRPRDLSIFAESVIYGAKKEDRD
jgi:hypothetical protein